MRIVAYNRGQPETVPINVPIPIVYNHSSPDDHLYGQSRPNNEAKQGFTYSALESSWSFQTDSKNLPLSDSNHTYFDQSREYS